jgi:hypothetical protein
MQASQDLSNNESDVKDDKLLNVSPSNSNHDTHESSTSFEQGEPEAQVPKRIPIYRDWKLITIFAASFITNAVFSNVST